MRRNSLILDTMLLVLFIVGSTDRDLVAKHKRLKEFSIDDFDYIDEPARTQVFEAFRSGVFNGVDIYTASKLAGHKDLGATGKRYAHSSNEALRGAANKSG